jgi:hypothetical protein
MDNFCVIVQGPSTQVDIVRESFRSINIPIIFSTWVGQEEQYKNDDIVIFNDYPSDTGIGNLNYQKITTLSGLIKAKEMNFKYALKFRSDMVPTNPKEFIRAINNDKLNFFAWHFMPDTDIMGYFVDYFMSGPIDKLIDIWNFVPSGYSIPESIITNRILKYSEKYNFLINILDDNNDIFWVKYNLNLKDYRNIKTTTWFGEIDLENEPEIYKTYKNIFK